jgi:hypothetical protein
MAFTPTQIGGIDADRFAVKKNQGWLWIALADLSDTTGFVPTEAEINDRIAFVDAANALAGLELTDPVARELVRRVAAGEITGDEAVAEAAEHLGVTLG